MVPRASLVRACCTTGGGGWGLGRRVYFTIPCNSEWEQCMINVVFLRVLFFNKCFQYFIFPFICIIWIWLKSNFMLCFLYCLCKVTVDWIEKHSKWQFLISQKPSVLQNVVDSFRFIGSPTIKGTKYLSGSKRKVEIWCLSIIIISNQLSGILVHFYCLFLSWWLA